MTQRVHFTPPSTHRACRWWRWRGPQETTEVLRYWGTEARLLGFAIRYKTWHISSSVWRYCGCPLLWHKAFPPYPRFGVENDSLRKQSGGCTDVRTYWRIDFKKREDEREMTRSTCLGIVATLKTSCSEKSIITDHSIRPMYTYISTHICRWDYIRQHFIRLQLVPPRTKKAPCTMRELTSSTSSLQHGWLACLPLLFFQTLLVFFNCEIVSHGGIGNFSFDLQ